VIASTSYGLVMLSGSHCTLIHFVQNFVVQIENRSDVHWGPGAFIDIGAALTWGQSDMDKIRGANG